MSRVTNMFGSVALVVAGWAAAVVVCAVASPLAFAGMGPGPIQATPCNDHTGNACTKCTTTCTPAADCAAGGTCSCGTSNGTKHCLSAQ
jgi:hypothetical protein